MREIWARYIVLFTGLIVVLLAMVFAYIQNPNTFKTTGPVNEQTLSATGSDRLSLESKQVEAGYQVYLDNNCYSCHSIEGKGNPRVPLDGVGHRHSKEALRNWITGSDELGDLLSERIRSIKKTYRNLSSEELDALVTYLKNV